MRLSPWFCSRYGHQVWETLRFRTLRWRKRKQGRSFDRCAWDWLTFSKRVNHGECKFIQVPLPGPSPWELFHLNLNHPRLGRGWPRKWPPGSICGWRSWFRPFQTSSCGAEMQLRKHSGWQNRPGSRPTERGSCGGWKLHRWRHRLGGIHFGRWTLTFYAWICGKSSSTVEENMWYHKIRRNMAINTMKINENHICCPRFIFSMAAKFSCCKASLKHVKPILKSGWFGWKAMKNTCVPPVCFNYKTSRKSDMTYRNCICMRLYKIVPWQAVHTLYILYIL